jgi:hypothetical protein
LIVRHIQAGGKRTGPYGAIPKGATLLNFMKSETSIFEDVVDRNPHKHNKCLPGPMLNCPGALLEDLPRYTLMLL